MESKEKIIRKNNIILSLLLFAIIIMFAISPKENMDASWEGVKVWALYLLPALFPFFILTKALSSLGTIKKVGDKLSGVTKFLFKAPGISMYVYLMSILSGYPVGGKLVADLYEDNSITRNEAIKITTFTSTSGPLFVVGTVGVGMLSDFRLGLIVLIAHYIGALLNGLLFRRYGSSIKENPNIKTAGQAFEAVQQNKNVLENIMWSSIKSVLIIGGYVSIFSVFIQILTDYRLLYPINKLLDWLLSLIGLSSNIAPGITAGFFEITQGCLVLSETLLPLPILAIILTFIISFGGLCVHLQAMIFLKRFNMKISFYFLIKITQAILSALVCLPLSFILI